MLSKDLEDLNLNSLVQNDGPSRVGSDTVAMNDDEKVDDDEKKNIENENNNDVLTNLLNDINTIEREDTEEKVKDNQE